ncbi:MAG: hypothetical protein ABI766_06110 [Gemmatimonadales bacterium]
MIAAVLWLALQGGAPTVGDTLWLTRTVAVPAGRTLRAADWHPDDPIELLGPPRITARGDSADITYPVVIWRPGAVVAEVPGPVLLSAGGAVDSLPPQRIALRIASVLPAVPADSALAPQPRAGFVARGTRSVIPLLIALGLAGVLLAPLHWWWRRRGPVVPTGGLPAARLEPPVDRWADAGESRAVAATATARLRAAIALRVPSAHRGLDTAAIIDHLTADRPDWPLDALSSVLRSLDEARFGDGAVTDVLALAREAAALDPRLPGGTS